MKIRSTLNGGTAEVGEELGKKLVAGGGWAEEGVEPKPVRKPRTRKPAPVEEPSTEE